MNDLTFSSGRTIPQLGLGTWQLTDESCIATVRDALEMGYTHVDTADGYGNHKEVGQGIKEAGISRDKLFLTTKIAKPHQRPEEVLSFGQRMLEELETDYVNLLLIHWPTKAVPFKETLDAMAELVHKGVVKDIGISNFNSALTAEAAEISSVPIAANQVEFHPLLFQKALLERCESLNIKLTAYSPLAQGAVFQNKIIKDLAAQGGISPAQLSIAWLLAKGIIAIPKSSGKEHLKSNLKAAEIQLEDEVLSKIDAIEEESRVIQADGWREFDW